MVLYILEDDALIFIAVRTSYLTNEAVFVSPCFSLLIYIYTYSVLLDNYLCNYLNNICLLVG
jgi:hypothetical protein